MSQCRYIYIYIYIYINFVNASERTFSHSKQRTLKRLLWKQFGICRKNMTVTKWNSFNIAEMPQYFGLVVSKKEWQGRINRQQWTRMRNGGELMRGNVILLVVRIASRDVKSRFNSHGFVTISWQKRINVTIIFCGVC